MKLWGRLGHRPQRARPARGGPVSARARLAVPLVGALGAQALGCALPPSDECRAFVACELAFDPSADVVAFDEGGACWQGLQTAERCTAQCARALDALRAVPRPPEACASGLTEGP